MKPYLVAAAARWFSLLLFTLSLVTLHAGPLPNPAPREDFWVTDGTVLSLLEHNGQLYVGGAFSSVGPNTGKGAIFSNAQSTPNLNWPKLRPRVHAAVSDGTGGWYVGGASFSDYQAGNAVRYLFTHLTNDRTIDADFNLQVGGEVYTLLRDGDTLYVGGNFIDIGGADRGYVAAIDLTTGTVKAWNPDMNLY
ncbi:MAG: Transrane protein, partial [Verrucomicrobia bacterium]|nr:Transrane protein [Verrucomicrobiota bacterium]